MKEDDFVEAKLAFDLIRERINILRTDLKHMSNGSKGSHLSKKGIDTCVNNLIRELDWGRPLMPCPNSHSSDKHPQSCRCLGSGFIPQSQKAL